MDQLISKTIMINTAIILVILDMIADVSVFNLGDIKTFGKLMVTGFKVQTMPTMMHALNVYAFLLAFIHLHECSSTTLTLLWLDTSRYPGGGFYFAAPSEASTLNWLIYLMGGAWCYSIESCKDRWNSNQTRVLMTNKYWKSRINGTGIFDNNTTLNPMANAYKIYIPYCTPDGWMGNKNASNDTNNWSFYGQFMIEAVIDTLTTNNSYPLYKNNSIQDVVWFGGCSAGARCAMVNLDYIPSIIQNSLNKSGNVKIATDYSIQVYGILDSAIWINVEPYS